MKFNLHSIATSLLFEKRLQNSGIRKKLEAILISVQDVLVEEFKKQGLIPEKNSSCWTQTSLSKGISLTNSFPIIQVDYSDGRCGGVMCVLEAKQVLHIDGRNTLNIYVRTEPFPKIQEELSSLIAEKLLIESSPIELTVAAVSEKWSVELNSFLDELLASIKKRKLTNCVKEILEAITP